MMKLREKVATLESENAKMRRELNRADGMIAAVQEYTYYCHACYCMREVPMGLAQWYDDGEQWTAGDLAAAEERAAELGKLLDKCIVG